MSATLLPARAFDFRLELYSFLSLLLLFVELNAPMFMFVWGIIVTVIGLGNSMWPIRAKELHQAVAGTLEDKWVVLLAVLPPERDNLLRESWERLKQ